MKPESYICLFENNFKNNLCKTVISSDAEMVKHTKVENNNKSVVITEEFDGSKKISWKGRPEENKINNNKESKE